MDTESDKGIENVVQNTEGNLLVAVQKPKRKHRRGPKHKNGIKAFRKNNQKFQSQHSNNFNNNNHANNDCCGGSNYSRGLVGVRTTCRRRNNRNRRIKLERSRSTLVPYNTNKFLMEEHMADLSNSIMTPSGRTRDSSFSVDSEDNYFFSLPEDEEQFLSKEFANVYEKARIERLEALTKQQLIEEFVALEDRYSSDQGSKHQQQIDVQRISADYLIKLKAQEERIRELMKANQILRAQLMRRGYIAASPATASPPSAACPASDATVPMMMDYGNAHSDESEDSESDSSTSTSSSSSSSSAASSYSSASHVDHMDGDENELNQIQVNSPNYCSPQGVVVTRQKDNDSYSTSSFSSPVQSTSPYNTPERIKEEDFDKDELMKLNEEISAENEEMLISIKSEHISEEVQ